MVKNVPPKRKKERLDEKKFNKISDSNIFFPPNYIFLVSKFLEEKNSYFNIAKI